MATVRDALSGKIAGVTVKMLALNGDEHLVPVGDSAARLDEGCKIVLEGWEEGHKEWQRLRQELGMLPEELRALTKDEMVARVEEWFK